MTAGFRSALGESAATVQQYDVPLAQATTSSFEALKAYSLAMAARRQGKGEPATRLLLERAVEIDPTFAMAQARLATVAGNLDDDPAARDHAAKAWALRARVGQYEQFYIAVTYHAYVTRDRAVREQTESQALATFPRSGDFITALANVYQAGGDYARSLPLCEQAVELFPSSRIALANLGEAYLLDSKPEQYYGVVERMIKLAPSRAALANRVNVAALSGDDTQLDVFLRAAEKEGSEEQIARINRDLALIHGQLRKYDDLGRRLMTLIGQRNDTTGVAELTANIVALDAYLDRPLSEAAGSVSLGKLSPANVWGLAWAYAFRGNAVMPGRLADEVDRSRSVGPQPPAGWPVSLARAAALFAEGRLPESRAALDQVASYSGGSNPTIYRLRGRTRQAQGDSAGAREDYQVFLQRRYYYPASGAYMLTGIVVPQTQIAAADLARDAGDLTEARRVYEDLRRQWKNADADFPLLAQIKDRLAKLGR